jgi:hypothetical protein
MSCSKLIVLTKYVKLQVASFIETIHSVFQARNGEYISLVQTDVEFVGACRVKYFTYIPSKEVKDKTLNFLNESLRKTLATLNQMAMPATAPLSYIQNCAYSSAYRHLTWLTDAWSLIGLTPEEPRRPDRRTFVTRTEYLLWHSDMTSEALSQKDRRKDCLCMYPTNLEECANINGMKEIEFTIMSKYLD